MKKLLIIIFLLAVFPLTLTACSTNWQIEVTKDGESIGNFNYDDYAIYLETSDDEDSILLGQMLYLHGFTLIDEVSLIDKDGIESTFIWEEIALETRLHSNGQVTIAGEEFKPITIDVTESAQLSEINYSIMDIAPTMASILGLPELAQASGEVQVEGSADFGVMILLDGVQYEKLQSMIAADDLPFLASLEAINRGLTVYPPVTVAATAALLTGSLPQVNGVYGHGIRSTELTTLFDLAVEAGKTVIAVEGNSLPFNLRNAEISLSGDKNGDGWSDDNVMTNSLEVINAGMPDLLYIHFHEIDDMGHEAGPESELYQAAAVRVDGYLSQIYEALPTGTFIAIFADHGMHAEGEGGNHGNLIESDLIIPIIFLEK